MTFVFVHGCGTHRGFWDTTRTALGDASSVAYSLPGRDDSPGEAPVTAAEAAAWIGDRLVRDGVTRPIFVGHSYGGGIAIELALRGVPAPVGLVLVCTGARLRVAPIVLAAVADAVATGVPCDLAQFIWRPDTDAAVIAAERARSVTVPVEATQRDWRATDAFDRLRDVATIAVPTLAIAGRGDVLTPPRYAEYLARTIPGARHEIVEDAGHMLPLERPAELAALLTAFAAEIAR